MTDFSLADAAADARAMGAVLFTVTVISDSGTEVCRVYSTHPTVYPVGGRKSLDPSYTSVVWAEQVLRGQRTFVGSDRAAVREFFADAATIEALGCGSIINTAVVADGTTMGSINFLAAEGVMTHALVAQAEEITRRAASAVRRAREELFPASAAS